MFLIVINRKKKPNTSGVKKVKLLKINNTN